MAEGVAPIANCVEHVVVVDRTRVVVCINVAADVVDVTVEVMVPSAGAFAVVVRVVYSKR
jgi:hypothetical protein